MKGRLTMTAHIRRYLVLAAVLLLALAAGGPLGGGQSAHADGEDEPDAPILVPSNWALRPSGIPVGGEFRLLVITNSMRDAQSADISDYDTFVQTEMQSTFAREEIREYGDKFRVVASTSAVCSPSSGDRPGTVGESENSQAGPIARTGPTPG